MGIGIIVYDKKVFINKLYLSVIAILFFPFVLFSGAGVQALTVAGAQLASRSQRPPRRLLKGKVGRTKGKRGTGREEGREASTGALYPLKREIPRLAATTTSRGKKDRAGKIRLVCPSRCAQER